MVVNASHMVSGSDDANIVSSSPPTCTSINQGRWLLYEMLACSNIVDGLMKCHNLQIIAFCLALVLLGCWWWRKDMTNVTWINMVCGLVDEVSKVIFIFFHILIIILMILWLWIIFRGGKGHFWSIYVAFGGGDKLGSRRLNSRWVLMHVFKHNCFLDLIWDLIPCNLVFPCKGLPNSLR